MTSKVFDDVETVSLDNVNWSSSVREGEKRRTLYTQSAIYANGNATQITKSKIIRRRLSLEDVRTCRMEATLSRCIQRRKHEAGRARFPPISSRIATVPLDHQREEVPQAERDAPMSHQTSSFRSVFPAQRIVLTP